MSKMRFPTVSVAGLMVSVLLGGAVGCNSNEKEVALSPAQNSLHSLAMAYKFASSSLNHMPRSVEELMPFLTQHGDPKTLLSSPTDGSELVIQWGTDPLKQQDGQYPVWVYEKNATSGQRWVIQRLHPVQMTDDQLREVPFAPGLKKPF